MHTRKSSIRLASILILICLLAAPAALESQCNVAASNVSSAGSLIQVFKVLSSQYTCNLSGMNGPSIFCSPTTLPQFTSFLLATAMTATVMPSCAWNCLGCPGTAPHATIDSSDGLPVELMDFAIEDDVAAVGGEEDGERAAS